VKLFLNPEWKKYWQGKDPFAEACALQGKVYRSKEGRRTLRFEKNHRGYFLKLHEGIGWAEIIKNVLQFRLPVLGAANEYNACNALKMLGVDTMTPVAFGERGRNPAKKLSFLITEELADTISLEDYCKPWAQHKPSLREKRKVIRKLAQISKVLHENGINHRDYYLCHFLRANDARLFQQQDALYLIDLHRAQIRTTTPLRWLVKDLSGLFYSAFDLPLTRRDLLCFLSVYRRDWLRSDVKMLHQIVKKAVALYQKDFGRDPSIHIQHIASHLVSH
jgi:heptose I phosphotransferase